MAFPGTLADEITVTPYFLGTLNQIYLLALAGQQYALRVRHREKDYAYEKNLLKEPVLARFFASYATHDSSSSGENERRLDLAIETVTQERAGGPFASPFSSRLIFFDQSRRSIPRLWTLHEWLKGTPIDSLVEKRDSEIAILYQQLGRMVADLHRPQFSHFRTDFLSRWRSSKDWLEIQKKEIRENLAKCGLEPEAAHLPIVLDPGEVGHFVLCHNDIHPLNVIHHQGHISLIDWDNLILAPREMDFVKLKYWTARNEHGYLSSDETLFQKALTSYQEKSRYRLNRDLFQLLELLWLSRILCFERMREASGRVACPPFYEAHYYFRQIKKIIG